MQEDNLIQSDLLDYWKTIVAHVEADEARYDSPVYRRIEAWLSRHTNSEVMIQPAVYNKSGRFYIRFFYGDDPARAKQDALLFRLWLHG